MQDWSRQVLASQCSKVHMDQTSPSCGGCGGTCQRSADSEGKSWRFVKLCDRWGGFSWNPAYSRHLLSNQLFLFILLTRNAHVYDPPRHALHMRGGRGEQLSTLLGWVGGKITIPGLWRLSNTCFLLLNSLLFYFCSLGFYGGLTSLLFSLSESLVIGWIQHSFLHLTLPNTYIAKGQPHSPHPQSLRIVPSINVLEYWMHVSVTHSWPWVQIDIPSVTSNWHSQPIPQIDIPKHDGHYVRMYIARIDPSFKASH